MHRLITIIPLVVSMLFLSSCNSNDDDTVVENIQTYVKVYKSDNSTHCGSTEIDLDVMELDLIKIGVDVVCSLKGHDGAVRPIPPLCRSTTGNINIYEIYSENLIDAESIGFSSVNLFTDYKDEVCK